MQSACPMNVSKILPATSCIVTREVRYEVNHLFYLRTNLPYGINNIAVPD
jgi:hypothetical protein